MSHTLLRCAELQLSAGRRDAIVRDRGRSRRVSLPDFTVSSQHSAQPSGAPRRCLSLHNYTQNTSKQVDPKQADYMFQGKMSRSCLFSRASYHINIWLQEPIPLSRGTVCTACRYLLNACARYTMRRLLPMPHPNVTVH